MEISWLQAILIGLCACLSSMPGMGGSSIGNYTLGRPLIGGFVCGIILGSIPMRILVGCAMQVVYIALVTPGETVSADVRAVSYMHSSGNGCVKKLWSGYHILGGGGSGSILRNDGRHLGNRIILWHSYH